MNAYFHDLSPCFDVETSKIHTSSRFTVGRLVGQMGGKTMWTENKQNHYIKICLGRNAVFSSLLKQLLKQLF